MNRNARLLLIGATGTIGSELTRQLVASGARVRAMTRRPNEARLPADVEPIYGDLTLPESFDAALSDVDAVFLVWTAPADSVAEVAKRIAERVGRLVLLTSPHQT
ncbi:MAG TPA: NAD(P)H-binding protein, partial [Gemmatimonadaceae bacterium]